MSTASICLLSILLIMRLLIDINHEAVLLTCSCSADFNLLMIFKGNVCTTSVSLKCCIIEIWGETFFFQVGCIPHLVLTGLEKLDYPIEVIYLILLRTGLGKSWHITLSGIIVHWLFYVKNVVCKHKSQRILSFQLEFQSLFMTKTLLQCYWE